MSDMETKAFELFKPPFKYDNRGGYIWDAEKNMVADAHSMPEDAVLRIRGWGRISYMENPEQLQDAAGDLIAKALTAYWQQPSQDVLALALVEALELAQGFLKNKGYSDSDPLLLGAINSALTPYRK